MKRAGGQSLTLRLTLLFAAVSTTVLLVLGALVAASVEQHFVEQDSEILASKLQLARQVLAEVRTRGDFDRVALQLDNALAGQRGLLLAIVAPDGEVLFASSGPDYPKALLERPNPTGLEHPLTLQTQSGVPLRGVSVRAETGAAETPLVLVAAATDISHHVHFMASFQRTLWGFVALAALISGLLGWFAARRGLAPLQAIQRGAAEVTAERLHTRLPVEHIPRELAAVAESLNAMLARLQDSFRRLSEFSSDLAHELRTPVSNLLTQTQVTLSKARSEAEYRDILSSNVEEFERMARMIADMLFLAKADHGLIVPQRETVDLAEETRQLFDFYEALAEEKGLKLTLEGEGTVTGDRLMLRRAIGNLLSNAIRHGAAQGLVLVRIARDDAAVRLTLSNTGTPIAAEHLSRLFNRFYRVDSARHLSSEGSGLGLAITQSIVAAHGGEIGARSGDGENIFEIRLPA